MDFDIFTVLPVPESFTGQKVTKLVVQKVNILLCVVYSKHMRVDRYCSVYNNNRMKNRSKNWAYCIKPKLHESGPGTRTMSLLFFPPTTIKQVDRRGYS